MTKAPCAPRRGLFAFGVCLSLRKIGEHGQFRSKVKDFRGTRWRLLRGVTRASLLTAHRGAGASHRYTSGWIPNSILPVALITKGDASCRTSHNHPPHHPLEFSHGRSDVRVEVRTLPEFSRNWVVNPTGAGTSDTRGLLMSCCHRPLCRTSPIDCRSAACFVGKTKG